MTQMVPISSFGGLFGSAPLPDSDTAAPRLDGKTFSAPLIGRVCNPLGSRLRMDQRPAIPCKSDEGSGSSNDSMGDSSALPQSAGDLYLAIARGLDVDDQGSRSTLLQILDRRSGENDRLIDVWIKI